MTTDSKSLPPEFVCWFARNQAASTIDLLRVFAGGDFLDEHAAALRDALTKFVGTIEGVVGAVEANRAGE